MGLNPKTSVLVRDRRGEDMLTEQKVSGRQRQREIAQGMLGAPEKERGREGFSSRTLEAKNYGRFDAFAIYIMLLTTD